MAAIILLVASCGKTNDNPLLADFATPHQTPPFDKIKAEHYEPAFDAAIEEAQRDIDRIANSKEAPTFENTIVALDGAGKRLGDVAGIFFNLNACLTDSVMQDIAQNVSPKLTAHGNAIYMNPALFARVKQVHEQKEKLNLNKRPCWRTRGKRLSTAARISKAMPRNGSRKYPWNCRN